MTSLERDLAWARVQMPLSTRFGAALPALAGVRLACSMHFDLKMIPAVEALLERGARVFLATCNPSTVRDEVVAYLVGRGAEAHAWLGMDPSDTLDALERAAAFGPTHTCEMGGDISAFLHDHGQTAGVRCGLEATGSGIARLRRLDLRYPLFNWDDLPIKEGLHNRWLVGLSTWQAFTERTHLSLHGKRVLVVGYGLVGQGVADVARAFGGTVSIAERDPARLLEARYAGWQASPLSPTLLAAADVVVTATGVPRVLRGEHFASLPEGCILLNVGHVADEIAVDDLGPREAVIPHLEVARPHGKAIYLFAGGSMANLTAGQGDTLNAFDLTLATMLAGLKHVFTAGETAPAGLHPLPRDAWEPVAAAAGRALEGERA